MIDRRKFSIGLCVALGGAALTLTGCGPDGNDSEADADGNAANFQDNAADPAGDQGRDFSMVMSALEKRHDGRLGVALIDTGSGRRLSWRGDERFPLCSTFKFLLGAATLARVDQGKERLDRKIPIAKTDIVAHSPETEKAVGGTMTVGALCRATITTSDNGAANLLLAPLGGGKGLTDWVGTIGDTVTRLDRPEPLLNEAAPGDPRDTTSPVAMAGDLERLLTGDVLSDASRKQLADWLEANTTGGKRIRAGAPAGWRVGDKTGTGENGATNDIAILWPPSGKPVLLALYLVESKAAAADNEAALAAATRAALGFVVRSS